MRGIRGRGGLTLAAVVPGCAAAALMLGAPAAPAAARHVQTARVSARVGAGATSSALVLAITRNGSEVYRRRVRSGACHRSCTMSAVAPGHSAVRVTDLDADHELEVVLGLFTGGADCCFVDQVFTYDPARRTYVATEHNFQGAGAALRRIDGHWLFVSGDSRVSGAGFTDAADSAAPLQIWRFSHHRFLDVTGRYPSLIRADAARWLRLFGHHLSNGVGLIAAWAADQDRLGHGALVDRTLRSLAARGRLRTPLGLPHHSAVAFITDLERLLRRLGYTR